jgi:hypothetical protein
MITRLQHSDWESHNAQLHIVRNNGDLRSNDLVGVPLEKIDGTNRITIPVVFQGGLIQHHIH